jgi:hypothetical protein
MYSLEIKGLCQLSTQKNTVTKFVVDDNDPSMTAHGGIGTARQMQIGGLGPYTEGEAKVL